MAQSAGIGKIGQNGLLFHSIYGTRLILGGIITTRKLPTFAWPETKEKGCPENCIICQEECPVNAIDADGSVDKLACVKYSMKSPLFSYFMKQKETNPKEAALLNHVTAVDDHSMYTCIKCVSTCPHG